MKRHDPRRLLSPEGITVLQATRCSVVFNHWWVVAVEGSQTPPIEE